MLTFRCFWLVIDGYFFCGFCVLSFVICDELKFDKTKNKNKEHYKLQVLQLQLGLF